MTGAALYGFAEGKSQAQALAVELGLSFHEIGVHVFPDAETLIRVEPPSRIAILYRSLNDPNAKLVELLLAASALRDSGAIRIVLVAPYLAYMRQDKAFNSGEAVSQKVIGKLLGDHFEALLTVDPHLHRIGSLKEIMPRTDAVHITAAPALSSAIDPAAQPILVGPDSESRQWVEAIADPLKLEVLVGSKERLGDDAVGIEIEGTDIVEGRPAILVDDIISSGATLVVAANLLRGGGAARIEALATHCLANNATLNQLRYAGIERIRSTDSVPGPTAKIHLAALLAGEIRARGWIDTTMQD